MANVLRVAEPLSSTGAILAIDYGRKRLGLALSDATGAISQPFATWNRTNRRRDLARLRELVKQRGVRRIVVGLPLHLDGTPSEMSREATGFAVRVETALGVRVEMVDERLTSWEAGQSLRKPASQPRRGRAPVSASKRKTTLDDLAAAVILRDYLARERAEIGTRS
jgi:putative holliday junction resolvase